MCKMCIFGSRVACTAWESIPYDILMFFQFCLSYHSLGGAWYPE